MHKMKVYVAMWLVALMIVGGLTSAITTKNMELPGTRAGVVVFEDDFEGNDKGWMGAGFWNLIDHPEIYYVSKDINPRLVHLPDDGRLPNAYSGSKCWWYGEISTGTFIGVDYDITQENETGGTSISPNSGELTSPPIDLTMCSNAYLEFMTWWEVEAVDVDRFDMMFVRISTDGGNTFVPLGRGSINPLNDVNGEAWKPYSSGGLGMPGEWIQQRFDLSKYVGNYVNIQFNFSTEDELYNGFRGWFIDDVIVKEGAPPSPVIDEVDPHSGIVGSLTNVYGNNFDNNATVKIGGETASAIISTTKAVVTVPQLPEGVYDVTITNPDGQSYTLSNSFTVTETQPPKISSIQPDTTPSDVPTQVTIYGENFASGLTASIGGIPLNNIVVVSSSEITATTPIDLPIGYQNVLVKNTDSQYDLLHGGFEVTSPLGSPIIYKKIIDWKNSRDAYSTPNGASWFSFKTIKGNCYGIASTEYLYWKKYIQHNTTKKYPHLPSKDANDVNDLELNYKTLNSATFAVTMHQVFQPGVFFTNFVGSLKDDYDELNKSLSNGEPVVIMVGPNDPHAIVVHGIELYKNKTARLNISDSNDPWSDHYAYYNLSTNAFSYRFYYWDKYGEKKSISWTRFQVKHPDIMQRKWFSFYIFQHSTEYIFIGYNIIVGDKNLVISTLDGRKDYFETMGDSSSFNCEIPGSVGITEGDIVAFAIPWGNIVYVDPPTSGSSFLYTFTVENTTDGAETYGYLLNMSSDSSYNYNIVIDNLTESLVIEPSNSSINLDLTVMHTDADGHYYVLNATEIPISESDKAEIMVKDWQSLNSTDTPSLELGMYKQGDTDPYATYAIANGDVGLTKNDKGPYSAFSFDVFWIIILLVIVTSLFLISFVLSKKRESEISPFPIEDEEETEVSKNKAPVPIETERVPERISLILPGNKILSLSSESDKIKIGRVMLYKYLPKEMKEEIFNISREHCELWNKGGQWYIEDKGSTNGTKVNGKEIKGEGSVQIKDGDELVLGNVMRIKIKI